MGRNAILEKHHQDDEKLYGNGRDILLHCCCGPCSTASLERLLELDWKPVLFFGNNNIYPSNENDKRYDELLKVARLHDLQVIRAPYDHANWLEYIKGLENCPEHGERCIRCFEYNLRQAYEEAVLLGISHFTTTLTVSRFKSSKAIFQVGESFEGFTPIDFKKKDGFSRSVLLSKQMGLYRQQYCGCEFSDLTSTENLNILDKEDNSMQEIFNRRSVRDFSNRKVEREKINRLLEAAMQAPSAQDQREWCFVVVDDPEKQTLLSRVSPYSRMIAKAPVTIAILCDTSKLKSPDYWEQDLGACTENLLLEATHQELGACWMGMAPMQDRMDSISSILRLPDFIKPFALVAVGYPQEGKGNRFIDRFDRSLIHFNQW